MRRTSSSFTQPTFGAVALALLLGATLLTAQAPPGQGSRGFRALSGAAAAGFSVPADVRLVSRGHSGTNPQAAVERYRQYVGDAEVLGGQLTVFRFDTGVPRAVVGAYYPGLAAANSVRLAPGAARAIAVSRRPDLAGDQPVTLMIRADNGRYFYRVELHDMAARWFFWVDAETGAVTNQYDGFATGTGIGVLGDTKDLTGLTTFNSNSYRMVSADGRQTTYDARNRQSLPGTLASDTNDIWDTAGSKSPGQGAIVDAQFYARVTDAYLNGVHGFNWLLHYGQGMVSSAHYGRNYNNAGWNGTQMVYGDGDGTNFIEFSGDLDVVGHELSHGVTEATSNLIYQNESGALNEAFSDMMGTAIEFSYGSGNWTIGEDITPGANGIRNMANPNEDGDPSHYADRYAGTADNGGVHTNSGIANHWFYLLANGGQNANPARASGTNVSGVGLAAAETIAFEGFTSLPANGTFCAARAATIAVAGGSDAASVADAWDEVGVDEALCGGSTGGDSGPVITNVTSTTLKGTKFEIRWTTDVPADSAVTFTCCGTYSSSALVTSHAMQFNGSRGVAYEYYVTSTDAEGHSSTEGPFIHQN